MRKQIFITITMLGLLLASIVRVPMRIQTQTRDKYRYHYEQLIK